MEVLERWLSSQEHGLPALAEDPSFNPSTHMVTQPSYDFSPGEPKAHFWFLQAAGMQVVHKVYMQAKHPHTENFKLQEK